MAKNPKLPSWQRIKQVFQQILDQPPPERVTVLSRLCADDSAVRAEVLALLAAYDQAGSFCERPAIELPPVDRAERATLAAGTRLGHYEILGHVATGGMGEVYRATDTRLGRSVAIKLLAPRLAQQGAMRVRFDREAQAVARLSHPHICTLLDVGDADGRDFLVFEYIEGNTLADRLLNGPLDFPELLRIAEDTLSALDHAHRQGVIHRDLKPRNILLTKDGTKLCDFGLARFTAPPVDGADASTASAATTLTTADEEIAGTLQYMSPEQLEHCRADERSDIFALGAVLYEMATGEPAFGDANKPRLIASVLTSQPPAVSERRPLTPPVLEQAIHRCLAKNPAERWQSAAELITVIRSLRNAGNGAPSRNRAQLSLIVRLAVALCVAATFVAVLLLVTFTTRNRVSTAGRNGPNIEASQPTLIRLTNNSADMHVTSAHISPDGRYLAFADPSGLQVRLIDGGETHRLANTRGMDIIGWKPDSSSVVAGECDERSCAGWTISLVGQERYRTGAIWPIASRVRVAPDGIRLLKIEYTRPSITRLNVDPMNGAPPLCVASGNITTANWSVDGKRILFVSAVGALESVPAEGGARREVFRAPRDQVIYDAIELPGGNIVMAMLPPGAAPGPSTDVELWKLHTDERGVVQDAPRRLTSGAASPYILSAATSADRIVFLSLSLQTDTYVAGYDIQNRAIIAPRRLTLNERDDLARSWMPDSKTLLISSTRNGSSDIFKQAVGSSVAEPFLTGPGNQTSAAVTSDGRWVLYEDRSAGDGSIMRIPLTGGAAEVLLPHVSQTARIQCALHGRCALTEAQDGAFVISSLHALNGKGAQLTRFPLDNGGRRLSPDGDAFAYIQPAENGIQNRIRVISFTGKRAIDIVAQGATKLWSLNWLPDGTGFLTTDSRGFDTTSGGKLVTVSRSGLVKVLWAPATLTVSEGVASPDSKHIAINVNSQQSNVWMLTGF